MQMSGWTEIPVNIGNFNGQATVMLNQPMNLTCDGEQKTSALQSSSPWDHYAVVGLPHRAGAPVSEAGIDAVIKTHPFCLNAQIGGRFDVLADGLANQQTGADLWAQLQGQYGEAAGMSHPPFKSTFLEGFVLNERIPRRFVAVRGYQYQAGKRSVAKKSFRHKTAADSTTMACAIRGISFLTTAA